MDRGPLLIPALCPVTADKDYPIIGRENTRELTKNRQRKMPESTSKKQIKDRGFRCDVEVVTQGIGVLDWDLLEEQLQALGEQGKSIQLFLSCGVPRASLPNSPAPDGAVPRLAPAVGEAGKSGCLPLDHRVALAGTLVGFAWTQGNTQSNEEETLSGPPLTSVMRD
ncbi:hypothetical protein DV515_00011575 [Chloebia gouldiae]|uniref:Uncharacterized protein n=1 Tax=Chloebia gouldiae TaxID=44316 RepID=A0A3L8S5Y4_CHLGU|nr:hypothetical protein DV515_00011575 [Chloebia gouldiae]